MDRLNGPTTNVKRMAWEKPRYVIGRVERLRATTNGARLKRFSGNSCADASLYSFPSFFRARGRPQGAAEDASLRSSAGTTSLRGAVSEELSR